MIYLVPLLVLLAAPAQAGVPLVTNMYDAQIKAASTKFLPGIPWKLLKAQYTAESRLNPAARSPVGAEGIAQFMPGTWVEVSKAMGYGLVDRRMAGPAIEGGAYYMMKQRLFYKNATDLDRHKFAAASYNAGAGHIIKAKKMCPSEKWDEASRCLELITGRHSKETLTYVARIWSYWTAMEVAR